MLNLRQADETLDYLHPTMRDTTYKSTMRFNANILAGNMGESVQLDTIYHSDDVRDNVDKNIAAH
jgi:hypothetical protein